MGFKPFEYRRDYDYADGWDMYALEYSGLLVPDTVYYLTKEIAHQIINRFVVAPQATVLDLNCGNGNDFPFFLERGWKVFGSDGSIGMLNKAYETYQAEIARNQLVLYHGSLETLDDQAFDMKFDLIYSITGGFSYVDDRMYIQIMEHLSHMLRPTGVIITCHLTPFCLAETIYSLLHLRFRKAFLRMKKQLDIVIKDKTYRMYLRSAQQLKSLHIPSLELQEVLPLMACTPPFQTGFKPGKHSISFFRKLEHLGLRYSFLSSIADQAVLVHRKKVISS